MSAEEQRGELPPTEAPPLAPPPDANATDDPAIADDEAAAGEEEDDEPLNSEDDVSDEEPESLFESDNLVVCQYEKVGCEYPPLIHTSNFVSLNL